MQVGIIKGLRGALMKFRQPDGSAVACARASGAHRERTASSLQHASFAKRYSEKKT